MVLGFWITPIPLYAEQVGRNQSADPTKRFRVPWAVLEPGWLILAKIAWKSHQWPMCTETNLAWKTWLEMTDTFFYLQRTVSQEALEPNPPLSHQSGWGVLILPPLPFSGKSTWGAFCPPPLLEHNGKLIACFFHMYLDMFSRSGLAAVCPQSRGQCFLLICLKFWLVEQAP